MLYNRLFLLEVCCSPDSILTERCKQAFGTASAERVAKWNGGDIETTEGRKLIKTMIREKQPRLVWISPECGPYSPMQRLNQRNPQQRATLEEKRSHARKQYEGACEVAKEAYKVGSVFVIELSERCEAWSQDWVKELEKLGAVSSVCHGCQVGLKNQKHELLHKGWKMLSNCEELIRHMSLKCPGNHKHGLCEGSVTCRVTAYYTPQFVTRVIEHFSALEKDVHVIQELRDGDTCTHALVNCHTQSDITVLAGEEMDDHPEENPEEENPEEKILSREDTTKLMGLIKRIHSATGHCSQAYLKQALRRRGARKHVLDLVDKFRCPACEEHRRIKPRNQASLEDIPPKWSRFQSDVGEWQHPETGESWKFIATIDEGSRFRLLKSLGTGKGNSPSNQTFIDFYESQWLPVFGKPTTIRLDPGGPWRSNHLDQYMAERGILVETVPAESHWQISLVERMIQTTKNMLTRLASELPEMSVPEMMARVVWAQNNHDQYLGFSPIQHAFGRNPEQTGVLGDWGNKDMPILTESGVSAEFGRDVKAMIQAERAFLDEQAKWRIQRALQSGPRKPQNFFPGQLVFYWRKQLPKSESKHPFKKGKFLGPARVLAMETRVNEKGEMRPGSVIWLYRGNRLIKASPQQLRVASDREEALSELVDTHQPVPWTIGNILSDSKRQVYEDISSDWEPQDQEDMEIEDDLPKGLPLDDDDMEYSPTEPANSPRPESGEKRKPQWPPPTHRARYKQTVGKPFFEDETVDDALLTFASPTPSVHLTEELACISLEIDLPSGKSAKNPSWLRDPEAFLVKQLKKNHVEVNERHLTKEELEEFKKAKGVEVKNFLLAKAFAKLPDSMKPDPSQVLHMRWVLTWKVLPDSQGRKAKARAVILGYMDPQYERRPTYSPTVSRTSKQLFLQMAASCGYHVAKGDVSGAFLQGREFQRQVLCAPLPEICEALELPPGSITRLTRAAYGLVEAPLEWYLTVNAFLEELGFLRQVSDPCVWGLFDKTGQPIGWVCGHVDDFMFAGNPEDPRWKEICKCIQERFRWGEWENNNFVQCGVTIQRQTDGGFLLTQPEYVSQIDEVFLSKKRWHETDEAATPSEKQQMRSVLGALSWHAGQLAMELSAPVGLLCK